MSPHNFREILDVSPDGGSFTCVGTTQKNARCRQMLFSRSDLSEAASLLDKMDRSKDLSTSYQYLEELAFLTLCPRWHQKPGYSQVNAVSNRWRRAIAQYEVETDKATIMKTQKALKKLKRTTEKVWTENEDSQRSHKVSTANLRNPNVLKERQANLHLSKPANTIRSKANDDPFTIDTRLAPSSKAPLEEPSSFSSQCSSRRPVQPIFSQPPLPKAGALTKGEPNAEQETANKQPSAQLHISFPPTPPASPEDREKERKFENEELPCTPTKVSSSIESIPRRTLTTTTTTKTEVKTSINLTKKSLEFDFGSQYSIPSKSFNFETPADISAMQLSNMSSSIWNMTGADPLGDAPWKCFLSGQPILSPETPAKTASVIDKDVLIAPEIHPQTNEESFGYATITSESKRFKTYLPARHQFGFTTPPETPDTSVVLEIKIDSFQDSFPGFSVKPAISRKPLPALQARNYVACKEHGNGHDGNRCTCGEMADHESVKAGCFHRFGLGRLKVKIVTKVDAFRRRVSLVKVEKHKS